MDPSDEHEDSSSSSSGSSSQRRNSIHVLPPEMAESTGSSQPAAAQSISGPAEFPTASSSGLGEDKTTGTASSVDRTPEALRIVLVGKTGCGKSSTGNTILGREEFSANLSSESLTKSCQKAESEVDGRHVAIVDTPGLFDTTLSNKEICQETYKSISLLAPGPHAFLLLVQIGRFTKEQKDAVEYIKAAFGKDADRYIMILFTHGDDLEEEMSIEEYLLDSDESLKSLIADCGNRFHVFNNKKTDCTQVKELLQKIDDMVLKNGGSCYTNEMFQKAEEAIQKEKERIMKEKDEEIRREIERIERKYRGEIGKPTEKEKQQDEEMKGLEKKLQETYEKKKSEQELQEQREREEKEHRCAEEVEQVGRKYVQAARAEAERYNSFLDSVLEADMSSVIKRFRHL